MKVYSKTISKKNVDLIIRKVQDKKELNNFSEEYIKKYSMHLLKKNSKLLDFLSQESDEKIIEKNKLFSKFIKDVREKARRIYGTYITKHYSKKEELIENIDKLLQVHISTKERFPFYEEVYSKIKEITCSPKSVLDLGCGLNPCASKLIGDVKYFAGDISSKDVDFLNLFFKKHKTKGEVFRIDLSEEKEFEKIKKIKTDWCLLFKALDPVEESNENITYKLIPAINSKFIIASFPTLTISRKKMRNPRRNWFEKVLNRLELEFEVFEIENELFYVVKK